MQHQYSTTLGLFVISKQHYCLSFSFNSLILCCAVLTGCGFNSNNFSKFEEKLGVTMPNKYERVFHGYETTIDSNLQYDIYKIKNDRKLDYQIQFQTDFEEELDLEKYVDAINQYKPLKKDKQ